eukprot:TRINITY_DN5745_c0_g1_i1.p2 TRINITY_DN5745_c0_g1~~TRINITY_DN5745_c0_g1_i1.p2  ORF type:complete len:463 (+),score=96.39 TRINITY_DN5745_c0_g1_i1:1862-3250(+)
MYQHSNPLVFSPQGLMKHLGMVHWVNYNLLTLLRNMLMVSWFCAAIGFGGRVSAIITGVMWFILHGYCVGMKGVNHRWYVAMYAMMILSISNTCELSLDNFIHSKLDWWPFFYERSSDMWGSLARKFIAFGAMMTLQGGAFAKLRNTGLSWGNGITLQYYCQREEGVWNTLRLFTLNNRWFAYILATASLILEGISCLVLFDDTVRNIIFFKALGMHIGIYFVMYPSYGPQSVTYLLCVSWGYSNSILQSIIPSSELIMGVRLVNAFCLFLVFISWFLLEWWPLTGVPMYSFNREGYQQSHLKDLTQLSEVSKEYVHSAYPWPIAWSMHWIEIRLSTSDKKFKTNESIAVLPVNRRFLPKHLRRILHKVVGVHTYYQTELKDKNVNIAKEFLEMMKIYYQTFSKDFLKQNKDCKLELVVLLKEGPHVLESVDLPNSDVNGPLPNLGLWVNDLEKTLVNKIKE